MSKSVFETLSKIDVNSHTEKKNGLTYLSWAWAWQTLKENYPTASYTVYENDLGFNYHTDGNTCWVKVGVTVEEQEHIEYLPVMDYRNKSIPKDSVTSFDVNKAIQRALTKAIARHGLGLYIYAGEDLPEPPKAEPISKEQVQELHKLIEDADGIDMEAFLKFAQADKVENIKTDVYQKVRAALLKKQKDAA